MKLGLYVHIPFCKSKCYYCDFASSADRSKEEMYVTALVKELKAYGKAIKGIHTIASIFIGGGTPTVLSPFLLAQICECIAKEFDKENNYEWTVEANPGTITKEHAELFRRCGVNRVSLGLQAYQAHLLQELGRIHTFRDWEESILNLKAVGIENINTDLMFGLPNQRMEEWKETLEKVIQRGISHISAYGLIIEEDTPFYSWYEKDQLQLPNEEEERMMYTYAKEYLKDKGYTHYEISNWSKPNQECKHNILYWEQGAYIGVGLGAHGYLKEERYHNTYDLMTYIKAQGDLNQLIEEREYITTKMQMEEFMFLGLRLVEGVSRKKFKEQFKIDIDEIYGEIITEWIKKGKLEKTNDAIYLTEEGRDISNQIMSSFLLD